MYRATIRGLVAASALAALLGAGALAAQSHDDAAHAGPTMNHHAVSDQLLTGGHFVGDGLAAIGEQGVEVVIDLRDKPPKGQKKKLAAAGIEWINVPVVWTSPQPEDFERFSAAMTAYEDKKVLVQCQANYRASAFTYLYRVLEQGVPEAEARSAMNKIWEPEGTWAEFVDDVVAEFGD